MNPFRNIWYKKLCWTDDRAWEMEVYRDRQQWLNIELDLKFAGRDHAGPVIDLCLAGFGFRMSWPNRRHWDYKNNCWKRDDYTKIPPKL